MPLDVWLARFVALTPVWPALGAVLIALMLVPKGRPAERAGRAHPGSRCGSASGALGGVALRVIGGPSDLRLGNWYEAFEYSFPLVLLFDGLSARCRC
jgi:hypothetical protein